MKLPIPSIEKQREIVVEYNTVQNRIQLNEQLIQKLEETAQTIYRRWFVEFEFPVIKEDGTLSGVKTYKSSGGKMVWSEELEKDLPEGWEVKNIADIAIIKGGKRLPNGESLIQEKNAHPYIKVADLSQVKYAILDNKYEYVDDATQTQIARYTVSTGDFILSIVGTIGIGKIIHESLEGANLTENCVKITSFNKMDSNYLYHYFKSKEGIEQVEMRNVGAVQAKLPIYNIESVQLVCPKEEVYKLFQRKIKPLNDLIKEKIEETIFLKNLKNLLLSNMTRVEVEKK